MYMNFLKTSVKAHRVVVNLDYKFKNLKLLPGKRKKLLSELLHLHVLTSGRTYAETVGFKQT